MTVITTPEHPLAACKNTICSFCDAELNVARGRKGKVSASGVGPRRDTLYMPTLLLTESLRPSGRYGARVRTDGAP
jgi:hypothetical protein